LEEQVEGLKIETRRKLIENIDSRYGALGKLKDRHESEMEPIKREIDILQTSLEEAMKKRLKMITRQVNEVKNLEDEIQITKRQLDAFDRLYGMGGPGSPVIPPNNIFEKDFECPVCYNVMGPPSRIFQCNNGHLIWFRRKQNFYNVRCMQLQAANKNINTWNILCKINLKSSLWIFIEI
jgi:hypothetical protein